MTNEAKIGDILVSGQPTDDEIRALRARDIATLINVRLPNELREPEGPKAEAAGLRYVEIPLNARTITFDDVHRTRESIQASTGGVLVHCHAGARAAVVVAIVEAERAREGASGALRRIQGSGFDVEGTPYADFIGRYFARPQA